MPSQTISHVIACCCLSLLPINPLLADITALDGNASCPPGEKNTLTTLIGYQKNYPDIPYQALRQLLSTGEVILIDANRPETYASGHLPGAISINDKTSLRTHINDSKNMTAVVYCGGPQCIAWHRAADWVANEGVKNIRHFSAGLRGWKLEGGEVVAMNHDTSQ